MTAARHEEHAPDARRRLFVADLLCVAASGLLVLALHRPLGVAVQLTTRDTCAHLALLVAFSLLLVLRLGLAGQYDAGARFSRLDDLLALVRAALGAAAYAVFATAVMAASWTGSPAWSRDLVLLGFGLPLLLLVASRIVGHRRQVAAFRAGRYLARALVIGGGPRAERLLQWMADRPHLGIHTHLSDVDPAFDVAHTMQVLEAELARLEPTRLLLALEAPRPELRAAIVREAAMRSIVVQVLPDVFEDYYELPYPRAEAVPVATLYDTGVDRFAQQLKHGFDRGCAALLIVLLLPLFAAVALLVWIDDRGPVLFAQDRVGERGAPFRVRKFRTMRRDAEARLDALRAHNEASGPIFKIRDDPRITRVGRWLRRTSLDELPQLWNVAFGEMSLVGPRPPIPSEVDQYHPRHRRRLLARPGMTGLWQVSGRSETTFDEMVELDLRYIERWSFWLDVRILLRTLVVVVRRRGAY
jgi:exopolysaccharide biosynthesis polyprenyl glycosylphosphotransferase